MSLGECGMLAAQSPESPRGTYGSLLMEVKDSAESKKESTGNSVYLSDRPNSLGFTEKIHRSAGIITILGFWLAQSVSVAATFPLGTPTPSQLRTYVRGALEPRGVSRNVSHSGTQVSSSTSTEDRYEASVSDANHLDPALIAEALKKRLGLTYAEMRAFTGIAQNTVHYWKRVRSAPRGSTAERLLRVHAMIAALDATIGPNVTDRWLRVGPESPLDQLRSGDLDTVERAAATLIYSATSRDTIDEFAAETYEPDVEFPVEVDPEAFVWRRSERRFTLRGD